MSSSYGFWFTAVVFVALLGWLCLIGQIVVFFVDFAPEPCEQLELYCFDAEMKSVEPRVIRCDIIKFEKTNRSPAMCRSLLTALQKAELPDE